MTEEGVYVYDDVSASWVRITNNVVVYGAGTEEPATPESSIQTVDLKEGMLEARYGYKAFYLNNGTSVARHGIAWTAIGTHADVELLTLVSLPSYKSRSSLGDNNEHNHVYINVRASGSSGAENGYHVRLTNASGSPNLAKYVNGASSALGAEAATPYIIEGGRKYWVRLRANGSSISYKVWLETEEEPISWYEEDTDADLATGYVALGTFATSAVEYHLVTVGVNGASAPLPDDINTQPSTDQYITFFESDTLGALPDGWTNLWTTRTAEIRYANSCSPSQFLMDNINSTPHSRQLAPHLIGVAWDEDLAKAVLAICRESVGHILVFKESAFTAPFSHAFKTDMKIRFKITVNNLSHWTGTYFWPYVESTGVSGYYAQRYWSINASLSYRVDNVYGVVEIDDGLPFLHLDTWYTHDIQLMRAKDVAIDIKYLDPPDWIFSHLHYPDQFGFDVDLAPQTLGFSAGGPTNEKGWIYAYVDIESIVQELSPECTEQSGPYEGLPIPEEGSTFTVDGNTYDYIGGQWVLRESSIPDISSIPDLWGWWAADQTNYSNLDDVLMVPDLSGNERLLEQPDPNRRPVFRANVTPTGLPAFEFDGSFLDTVSGSAITLKPATVFVVLRSNDVSVTQPIISGAEGSGATTWFNVSSHWNLQHESIIGGSDVLQVASNAWLVGSLVYSENQNDSFRTQHELQSFSGPSQTPTARRVRVGGRSNLNHFFDGHIAEVIIFNMVLSEQDHASVRAYLEDKYLV